MAAEQSYRLLPIYFSFSGPRNRGHSCSSYNMTFAKLQYHRWNVITNTFFLSVILFYAALPRVIENKLSLMTDIDHGRKEFYDVDYKHFQTSQAHSLLFNGAMSILFAFYFSLFLVNVDEFFCPQKYQ